MFGLKLGLLENIETHASSTNSPFENILLPMLTIACIFETFLLLILAAEYAFRQVSGVND